MPRFTQPFRWWLDRSEPNGPSRIIMRADLLIEVEDRYGEWIELHCMIDTGASFPTMPTSFARWHDLEVPDAFNFIDFETGNR